MSYSDVVHFSNMLAGCESINAGQYKDPDSVYAQTVLKLHANDAGLYAGQEGFLDSVKKGAEKTAEWAKKLFDAIKKWFSEVFKSTKSKVSDLFTKGTDEEKAAAQKGAAAGLTSKIEAIKSAATSVPDDVNVKGVAPAADKAIDALKGDNPSASASALNALLGEVDKASDSFTSYCAALLPKKQNDPHAPYDKAVKEYRTFATAANNINVAITAAHGKRAKK